jgi:hypothetical protein
MTLEELGHLQPKTMVHCNNATAVGIANNSVKRQRTILHFVVASAAEAKLGALFLNCKEGVILRMTLEELGHLQPKTMLQCNRSRYCKQFGQETAPAIHGKEVFLGM